MKSRWHVFEHMKNFYMATGRQLTVREVYAAFKNQASREEIEEGIAEFISAVHSMPLPKPRKMVQ
ncbi:hypothetical protein P4S93_09815 [Aneurinibacillus thermoaerophilus]|uniref:hypothetical protein n=1 Tax=Aneurinibacillus thermoaerophilus TaxID=143495 RepID=UPI002E1C6B99|nr:hypothetical protein [Aneurinibacillus thermoaerophilus]MED0761075.1 hypothetical protein [Aneurinibacillus thermoaerophilus]